MNHVDSPPESYALSRGALVAVHAGFVLTGIVTTILGPALPLLSSRWALSDTQSGYLFTAQFAGSMTGVFVTGRLIERLGFLRLIALCFVAMALGSVGLAASSFVVGLLASYVFGIGIGMAMPSTNLLIAEANPGRRASALNVLNFAWSLGATVCPLLVGFAARRGRFDGGLIVLAGGLMVIAASLYRRDPRGGRNRPVTRTTVSDSRATARNPFVLVIGAMIFVYVGTESAISGWISSYAQRLGSTAGEFWSVVPSVFWASLLAGRAIAPLLLRFAAGEKLVLAGLLFAAVGVGLLLSTDQFPLLIGGTALAGLGFASVYPNTLAALSQRLGPAASRVTWFVFSLAGLGGATMTWLVGFLSTTSGQLGTGLLVVLVATILMVVLQAVLVAQIRRPAERTG